ncbi:MAG: AmmeMemoRadiSam system protein A, partial [Bacteroidales bacterium]|nr:AmmeMemoRadiSam system protein A [Bacteroidales bacterium]
RMKVNQELANKLKNEHRVFNHPVSAHFQEHSIEVQIPFIQYYFKSDPMLVPIIIGTNNTSTIKKIADALRPYFTRENLFVISSDFCHYPDYEDAKEVDNITANSIVSGDPQAFLTAQRKTASRNIPGLSTSMCGWTSGLVLMYLAEGNSNLEYKKIDYCNSGDSPYGNKEEVVGYHAIALIEKTGQKSEGKSLTDEIFFTPDEKKKLFEIARNSIYSGLYYNKKYTVDKETLPQKFNVPYGAFVTLKIKGALRGCIGRFISQDPLYKAVIESAYSSAFEDPRFTPLTKEEFNRIEMEITILGPLRKIDNIKEIVLGKHGIYIKKDFRAGTMLPQVATENGWTVEEFLGYTSRDKAGIGWDGWKNAEIFVYEGIVLEENKN